jgi:hypothetical protein
VLAAFSAACLVPVRHVLLNLALIVLTMIPSFGVHVSPKIPLKLGKAYYALATVHAMFGSVIEIAGLYILLAAGTSVLPEKFRLTKYKAWMRRCDHAKVSHHCSFHTLIDDGCPIAS